MKKVIILGMILISVLSFFSFVLAEEFTQSEEITLITPNPEVMSEAENSLNENVTNFGLFRERARLFFTFNKEKRAERELRLAALLLNRARIAAKNNNTRAMEKAIEEHNRIMERVRNRIEDINKQNISSEKLKRLDRAIEVHEARIERFNQRLEDENLSQQQKDNIEKMLNNSQKSIQVLNQLKELRQEREQIRQEIRENLSNKNVEEAIQKRIQERQQIREELREQAKERVQQKK